MKGEIIYKLQLYYKDEYIRLFQGDCLEVMDKIIEKGIKFDMILTDPPYGTTACKWDSIIPFEDMWSRINNLTKENGTMVFTASQPFTSELIHSNLKLFREHLVWVKHKPSNFACGKYMHLKYHEDIVIFCNGKPIYNPQMQERKSERVKQMQQGKSKNWRSQCREEDEVAFQTNYEPREWTVYDADKKLPSTIIEIPAVNSNGKEKVNHPTQKPTALFEYLIKTYTNENDLILDFTCGSGTTLLASRNLKRKCIGIELEEKYCEIEKNRLTV